MKKTGLLTFIAFALTGAVLGQHTGSIKGKLIDSVGHQLLSGASIVVLNIPDSTLAAYTAALGDASFAVDGLAWRKYLLQVRFQGYKTVYRTITLTKEAPIADLGILFPDIRAQGLDSVVIKVPPVLIRKDTIEFNAGSFKTRPYAYLEELLKKIPGVQIDANGGITVNGQSIDQLLVDGRPFFGGDIQATLGSLPAEIIDKVQVYNALSDQAAFTGFDDGSRRKTINVTIRNNRRQGDFGSAFAAAGTSGTYAGGISMNHLNGKQQISLVGGTNDINSANTGGMGNQSVPQAGAGGITQTTSGGINYRSTWDKNIAVNGSYLYTAGHTVSDQQINSLNLFPEDSSTSGVINSSRTQTSRNQRVNFTIEDKSDPSNTILFKPNVVVDHGETILFQENTLTGRQSPDTLYRSAGRNSATSDRQSVSGELLYGHNFGKSLRTVSISLQAAENEMKSIGFTNTRTTYVLPAAYTDNLDLNSINTSHRSGISSTITYTEPMGRGQALEVAYKYRYSSEFSSDRTYNLNSISLKYDIPDSLLSNAYSNVYSTQNASVGDRLQGKKYVLTAGIGIQADDLTGNNRTDGSILKEKYLSVTPVAGLTLNLAENQSLLLNYDGRAVPLSIQQLQPLNATTDSLYIQKGNPYLKQPYVHTFSAVYNCLSAGAGQSLSVTFNGSITRNAVQNAIVQLANGTQIATPANVNGSYTLYGSINYSAPVKGWGSRIDLLSSANFTCIPSFLNNTRNDTRTTTLNETISWTTNFSGKFDLTLNAASAYNMVHYSLQASPAGNYFTEVVSASAYYFVGYWALGTGCYYAFNNSLPSGFQVGTPILSPTVARRFLKNKRAEVKCTVSDILNQHEAVFRSVTTNTIQDTRSNLQGRYFMLSFTYSLSRFGSRTKTP